MHYKTAKIYIICKANTYYNLSQASVVSLHILQIFTPWWTELKPVATWREENQSKMYWILCKMLCSYLKYKWFAVNGIKQIKPLIWSFKHSFSCDTIFLFCIVSCTKNFTADWLRKKSTVLLTASYKTWWSRRCWTLGWWRNWHWMLDKQERSSEIQSSPWKHDTSRYVPKVCLKFLKFHKRCECCGLGNSLRLVLSESTGTMGTQVAFSITLIAADCHGRCERTEPSGRLRGRGSWERWRLSGVQERRQRGGSEWRRRGGSRRRVGRRRWCNRRWWDCDAR